MKFFSFIITMLLFITAGCSTKKSPVEVAKEYLSALDNADFEKAKQQLVQNEQNLRALENIRQFNKGINKKNIAKSQFTFTEENKTAGSAKIIATNDQAAYTVVIEFTMVKIDGIWLIESFTTN